MRQDDIQHALRFLSLYFATADVITADSVRRAIEGPIELGDIPTSVPWPIVETVIRLHPTFLAKDPARRAAWDLRDADPLNRIRLTKALVDATDNRTLDPVDLLGGELRARPDLIDGMLRIAEDLAEVLADADFGPRAKEQMLADLLATV